MIRSIAARLLAACACLAAASVQPDEARADVLFQKTLQVNRSVNIFTTSQFGLKFFLDDSFVAPTQSLQAFNFGVTAGGAPFSATLLPGDPNFDAVAARITDANDDLIRLVLSETSTGRSELRGWFESGFSVDGGTRSLADLAGAVVDRIELKMEQFTLIPAGAAGAGASPVDLRLTFTVSGIPEPQSLSLAVFGLATLGWGAYTKARRR